MTYITAVVLSGHINLIVNPFKLYLREQIKSRKETLHDMLLESGNQKPITILDTIRRSLIFEHQSCRDWILSVFRCNLSSWVKQRELLSVQSVQSCLRNTGYKG
jgi:hypothetical protein